MQDRKEATRGGRPGHSSDHIKVHGARENNLRNIDANIQIGEFGAVSGVSGSGKSTLAMDVPYVEGSCRYLDVLSMYTRRRIG